MLGGAATLFFEQYIFPDGAPMIILYAAMAFGAGLMIFGYGPKVWYLWWLKRQKPMTFDLQIVELSSLYSFIACLPDDKRTRFLVTWDKRHKNKFGVTYGDLVRVTGKMSKPMTDSLNELVKCDVSRLPPVD